MYFWQEKLMPILKKPRSVMKTYAKQTGNNPHGTDESKEDIKMMMTALLKIHQVQKNVNMRFTNLSNVMIWYSSRNLTKKTGYVWMSVSIKMRAGCGKTFCAK